MGFFKVLDANGDGKIDGFENQAYETRIAPEITRMSFPGEGAASATARPWAAITTPATSRAAAAGPTAADGRAAAPAWRAPRGRGPLRPAQRTPAGARRRRRSGLEGHSRGMGQGGRQAVRDPRRRRRRQVDPGHSARPAHGPAPTPLRRGFVPRRQKRRFHDCWPRLTAGNSTRAPRGPAGTMTLRGLLNEQLDIVAAESRATLWIRLFITFISAVLFGFNFGPTPAVVWLAAVFAGEAWTWWVTRDAAAGRRPSTATRLLYVGAVIAVSLTWSAAAWMYWRTGSQALQLVCIAISASQMIHGQCFAFRSKLALGILAGIPAALLVSLILFDGGFHGIPLLTLG
uniref:EF-hand domain-containing protein n=1 Tax=Phenylobacterium glaciei TaxID=2803784 RepID=A0A974P4C9_9CAUL|nr:hypothetical protein JKL49_05005 [Phenylobacterium glaciei]